MNDDEALDNALASRRIPHGRSRNKQGHGKGKGRGKGGNTAVFDPLRALGYYEAQLGSDKKRGQPGNDRSASSSAWLEIHELTAEDDGLMGTFSFQHDSGRLAGICALAGSRKGLQQIVESLEESEEDEDPDVEGEDDDDNDKIDSNDVSEGDEDDGELEAKTELELTDEKLNRRFRAFEKNSFRNPKFWMRWKGRAEASPSAATTSASDSPNQSRGGTTSEAIESELGYIVFTSNDCSKFDGTVTCSALGWDNLKMQGRKVRTKATPCPTGWKDF